MLSLLYSHVVLTNLRTESLMRQTFRSCSQVAFLCSAFICTYFISTAVDKLDGALSHTNCHLALLRGPELILPLFPR
jgi:hypothetical protein